MIEFDIEKSSFAIAVTEKDGDHFVSVSQIFSLCFPGIESVPKLMSLVSQRGAQGIVLSRKLVSFNEMSWELFVIENIGDYVIYLLKDVSPEFEVLKRLKENIAPLKESNQLFNEIFKQYIPIGILVVDSNYNVQFANNYLKMLFNIPKTANLKKCYNYRKRISPCPECLFVNFKIDIEKSKLKINTKDKLITSRIFQINDKYLILFTETTKEINLINEIKKQQTNLENANLKIAEQNNILKRLSDINIQIGLIKEMEPILKKIAESIIETFRCKKGAIILCNERNNIEYAYFSAEITDSEQESLIQFIRQKTSIHESYTVLQIKNNEDVTGEIFLFNPEKEVDKSILDLFMAQVSIYLENIKLQKRLEEVAQIDGLTGVFNRYYLDKKFEEEKILSEKFNQPLSLILADVNGLKEANDAYGHEAGDLLIKETAAILKDNVSLYDSVFRLGGDEFVILLVNCPDYHLKIMVNMFRDLQLKKTVELKNRKIPIRFSIGGACSTEFSYEKLKDMSDKEMYLDKKQYYKEVNNSDGVRKR